MVTGTYTDKHFFMQKWRQFDDTFAIFSEKSGNSGLMSNCVSHRRMTDSGSGRVDRQSVFEFISDADTLS